MKSAKPWREYFNEQREHMDMKSLAITDINTHTGGVREAGCGVPWSGSTNITYIYGVAGNDLMRTG
jgi:hypothetical protein